MERRYLGYLFATALGAAAMASSAEAADLHGLTERSPSTGCEGADCAVTSMMVPEEPVPADGLGVPTPVFDPGGEALTSFYNALDRVEREGAKARVVLYGASHVAGDVFTKVIRHRLKERYGDAGPGFVVPSYPWRNYNHRDVTLDYTRDRWEPYWVSNRHSRDDGIYGLAGISFVSDDKAATATVETATRGRFGRSIDSVEVYYWSHRKGGDFYVEVDDQKPKRVRTRQREAGPGYARIELKPGPHKLLLRPRGNGPVTLFGLAMERDVPGVIVDTMGINGARASAQLQWDPRLFAEHLAKRDPDLVVLAYGTNATGDTGDPLDAYEKRLDHVVNRVRSLQPEASCLIVGPSDRPIKVEVPPEEEGGEARLRLDIRPRQALIVAAQRRVAERYGCGHWDMVAAMGGDLSMVQWVNSEPRLGAKDYVHLTRPGYERMGNLLWDAMMAGATKAEAVPAPAEGAGGAKR